MEQNARLSRLMRISLAIQKKNKATTRSKALTAAWAIFTHEDITVLYLTRKLNHNKPLKGTAHNTFTLFTQ